MVYSISYKSEPTYSSIEHKSGHPDEVSARPYHHVDIYRRTVVKSDKKMTIGAFLCRCLCCKRTSDEELDSPVFNPSSALVGPTGRSYTLNDEPKKSSVVQETSVPSLIVTRPLDDEFSTSTTALLLASERNASEINLGAQNYSFKKMVAPPSESSQDSGGNSRYSTLKSGEKISFIREILSCRDTFLKSLEWCDNSLTRSKRCRLVKPDDWLELKNDGTETTFDYFRHALFLCHK